MIPTYIHEHPSKHYSRQLLTLHNTHYFNVLYVESYPSPHFTSYFPSTPLVRIRSQSKRSFVHFSLEVLPDPLGSSISFVFHPGFQHLPSLVSSKHWYQLQHSVKDWKSVSYKYSYILFSHLNKWSGTILLVRFEINIRIPLEENLIVT